MNSSEPREIDYEVVNKQLYLNKIILIVSLSAVGILLIVTLAKVILVIIRSRRMHGREISRGSAAVEGQCPSHTPNFSRRPNVEVGRRNRTSPQNGSYDNRSVGKDNRGLCVGELAREDWALRESSVYDDTEVSGSPRAALPHGVVGSPYDYPHGGPRAVLPRGVVGSPYDYPHGGPKAVLPRGVVGSPYDYPQGTPRSALPHGVVGTPYDYPQGAPRAALPHDVVGNPYDYPHGAPRSALPQEVVGDPQGTPRAVRAFAAQHIPHQAGYDLPQRSPVPLRSYQNSVTKGQVQ